MDVCVGKFPLRLLNTDTAQKMKFSIKDFFCKYEQIRRKLRSGSHLLKKSLMENFFFCAVKYCNAEYKTSGYLKYKHQAVMLFSDSLSLIFRLTVVQLISV